MATKVLMDIEQAKLIAKLAAKFVVFWDNGPLPPNVLDVIVKLAIETEPTPEALHAAWINFDTERLRTLCEQTGKESGG